METTIDDMLFKDPKIFQQVSHFINTARRSLDLGLEKDDLSEFQAAIESALEIAGNNDLDIGHLTRNLLENRVDIALLRAEVYLDEYPDDALTYLKEAKKWSDRTKYDIEDRFIYLSEAVMVNLLRASSPKPLPLTRKKFSEIRDKIEESKRYFNLAEETSRMIAISLNKYKNEIRRVALSFYNAAQRVLPYDENLAQDSYKFARHLASTYGIELPKRMLFRKK